MPKLFHFLRRERSKSDPKKDRENGCLNSDDGVPAESSENQFSDDRELEGKLSRVNFPVVERTELMKALGGRDAQIKFGTRVYQAGEIVDRCFTGRNLLRSPQDVLDALSGTSWTQVLMEKLHMLPFPVESRSQLEGRLKGTLVEGVPVLDILGDESFPIQTPSDLLAKLAGLKSKNEAEDGMESDAKSITDPPNDIPNVDGNLSGEKLPSEDSVQLVEEAST